MKFVFVGLAAAFWFTDSTYAAEQVKLVGILRSENKTYALFDISFSPYASAPTHFYRTSRLAIGERDSVSKAELSLSSIEVGNGLIHYNLGGTNLSSQIKSQLPSSESVVAFNSASVDQLLAIYSILTKKNVLPHQDLPSAEFTFAADLSDPSSAAEFLRNQLGQREIAIVPFTENFEVIVPKNLANAKIDRAQFIKPGAAAPFEAGTLVLHATPFSQIFEVCADILKVEPTPAAPLRNSSFALRHEIRLTKQASAEEVADALQLLFQWEGFRLVKDQAGKVSVVSDK